MKTANKKSNDTEKKWWQWFLIYPTLIISVMASIPTYYELYSANAIGVEYGTVKQAKTQQSMWEKNLKCLGAPEDWLVTPNNTKVDATICRSGDVLVRIDPAGSDKIYQWVSVDSIARQEVAFTLSLFAKAYASPQLPTLRDQQNNTTVLCQRWVKQGHLLRRLQVQGKGCYDEIVNTYSGAVISNKPAPCNSQC